MQFNSKRVVISSLCLLVLSGATSLAQGVPGVVCKPVSQRTQEIGCWILADDPIGQLKQSPVFWHLDGYPARAAAEADRGPTGTVVESFGKVWLMTIDEDKWRPGMERGSPRLVPFRSLQAKSIRHNTWRRSLRQV